MNARRITFAELLVLGEQRAQPLRRHLDHLAGVAHDRGQIRRRAGDQVDVAEEAVAAVYGDDAVARARSPRRSSTAPDSTTKKS